MKDTYLARRTPYIYTALELLFTVVNGAVAAQVLGMQPAATAALFFSLFVIRVVIFYWLYRRLVEPSLRLQLRNERGRAVTATDLLRADATVQEAPRTMVSIVATGWALTFVVAAAAHHLLFGALALHYWVVPVVGLLSVVGVSGSISIVHPLLTWSYSAAAGRNHLLARTAGVELERSNRSLAVTIAVMGVGIAMVPAALLVAAGLSAQVRASESAATTEVRLLATVLAGEARDAKPVEALALVADQFELHEVTLFVMSRNAPPEFAGSAAPAWATPELLVSVAANDETAHVPGGTVRALPLGDGEIVGAIHHGAVVESSFLALVGSAIVVVFLAGLISSWLLSRSVSGPLERTAAAAARAAREGDLSRIGTLPVAQLDEVGTVTLNLNELLDRMRDVATAATELGQGNLQIELEGDGELPDAFRAMLGQLRELVGEMQTTATELASAAAEISAASQEQDAAATSHSAGMAEISQTMDSLSDSATHVATAVKGVLENAERTLQNTDQMVARIDDLTGHANRIGDILDVIKEIANRTDLLALNGSLEASRAGEAGVGFSLVAAEMRRLAERVTGSVGDINQLVSDIRESGASTVVATEESKKLAQGTTEAARGITLVTQQQQSSTEQVGQNVRSVAEVVQQSATATAQTRASAESLKVQADRIATLVNRFQTTS